MTTSTSILVSKTINVYLIFISCISKMYIYTLYILVF
nr:MAG TPA: hypothetical protein [Caudoviricetes sp.]